MQLILEVLRYFLFPTQVHVIPQDRVDSRREDYVCYDEYAMSSGANDFSSPFKVCDEITYPFLKFNAVEV